MLMDTVLASLRPWLWTAVVSAVALVLVLVAYWLTLKGLRRVLAEPGIGRIFLDNAARVLGAVLSLLVLRLIWQGAPADLPQLDVVAHVITLALIVSLTWAAVRCSAAVGDAIVHLYPPLEHQSRQARKIETQARFITRGFNILIVLVGLGAVLMTFSPVRQLGTSLLASAGIGGIVLGFAARPVLTNLLAGMQIALTQPFRIDDVLYVQDEWCWVEEVTSTYVVLRVWDLRRLVIPLQWFIDNPFENWTRHSTNLIGTIFLWVDYRMPVERLREAFQRILAEAPQWDGKTSSVMVTDADSRAMQVRFVVSARNSMLNWELRCHVREHLIAFVQANYPEYLPRVRASIESPEIDHAPEGSDR